LHSSWDPVMCCSFVRTAVSKVASRSGHGVVINIGIWFLLKPTYLYCELAHSGNFAFQWKFFPITILQEKVKVHSLRVQLFMNL
jgi:hypothetical protein